MRELHFFVIAGENSGDLHGANLIKALRVMHPRLRLVGLGGKQLEREGVRLLSNIVKDLAIIGIVGVISNFPRIRRVFNMTMDYLKSKRPDAVILIDYAGFNLRIARQAKKLGIPVIWYISPQVWAWHGSRKYELARVVTKMIVIFPFEEAIYRELDMDVEYVGHPLFDVIRVDQTKEQVYKEFGLDPARPLITMIPGSRDKEVQGFLGIMLEGARRYQELHPEAQFTIIRATTIKERDIKRAIEKADLGFDIPIVDRLRYNLRAHADFSWVKSGTSTLESAILGSPMLIVYRVNSMTWVIGKELFTIGYIGLPNIVANNRIVPELLQDEFTPQHLVDKTEHYLNDRVRFDQMVRDLAEVKARLGGPGASQRAALAVLDAMGMRPEEQRMKEEG